MLNILKQFSQQLIAPDLYIRKRFATFQQLLDRDRECHRLLAQIEDIFYNLRPADINRTRTLYHELSAGIRAMIDGLADLAPGRYKNLLDYYKKIDFYARFALAPPKNSSSRPFILPIAAVHQDDRHTGGKGLHLCHLAGELGLPVPAGFIISTSAFNLILERNNLRGKIDEHLARVDIHSCNSLQKTAKVLSAYINRAELPAELVQDVEIAVNNLAAQFPNQSFAVRSSAVGEDSSLSFAGQYRSLLNVKREGILAAYRQVLASKYTPEAILYRIVNGFDDEQTPMAVIVLVMVEARLSGVVTTGNPASPADTDILVHSVEGPGDSLMAGQATATTTHLSRINDSWVISRRTGEQPGDEPGEEQLQQLALWAQRIAGHYKQPQEIEWCCDACGATYLLQSRRLLLQEKKPVSEEPDLSHLPLLFRGGLTAAPGIGSGPACCLPPPDQLDTIAEGSILLCEVTPPSLVTLLPRLAGVIARYGSTADHFSSVAREFGIPVLVQAEWFPCQLENNEPLTLWADKKEIYRGGQIVKRRESDFSEKTARNPFFRTLKMVIGFTSPLMLIDPSSPDFLPENCRSLHDILRFVHEKAVQAMFSQRTDSLLRKPKRVQLQWHIPLQMHLIDVGGGLQESAAEKEQITLADVRCRPLLALWQGLSHPHVHWGDRAHFDWQSYDAITLAGGVVTKNTTSLTSFCLVSEDYFNVNMRFGYHFTLLDSLCSTTAEENYILLRFGGGGGSSEGKDLRLLFLARVLSRLNFICEQTGELLDARLMRYDRRITATCLDQLGRLLGAVRLLDMVLIDEGMIASMVEDFFQEKYDFSNK